MKRLTLATTAFAAAVLYLASASAQNAGTGAPSGEPKPADEKVCMHKGQVTEAAGRFFETVCSPKGLRIYGYTGKYAPTRLDDVTGSATVVLANGTKKTVALKAGDPSDGERTAYFCPMHPEATQFEPGTCAACGGMTLMAQNRLAGEWEPSADGSSDPRRVRVVLRGLTADEITYTVDCAEASDSGGTKSGDGHGGVE
jgi:hypothetical protein